MERSSSFLQAERFRFGKPAPGSAQQSPEHPVHPVEMFREAFARLDLPFAERMQAHCAGLVGRPTSVVKGAPKKQKWKDSNPAAIERILPTIAPLMREMGYDPDD